MVNVESSNINQVGYDSDSNTLIIKFHSGGLYCYFDVDENLYNNLLNADSVGKFFNQHVKNLYDYQRIE